MQPLQVGLVVPRFHPDIFGGAELHARWLAEHLAAAGHDVTVLTTAVLDPTAWRDELPLGRSQSGAYAVHRFAADPKDLDRWLGLDMAIRGGQTLTLDDEETWLRTGGASSAMERYLAAEPGRFDVVLGIPYMAATTYFAFRAVPDRFCAIPCLHDEPFARLRYVDRMLSQALGTMCNSWPELDLARRLHPRIGPTAMVGLGFDEPPSPPDPALFRRKYGVEGRFAVFVGRLQTDKNLPQLLEYFVRWKERQGGDLQLVLVGEGDVVPPSRPDIRAIRLDWADRDSMLAAAECLVQPSLMESLSIVTMQAWQAGSAVLTHGRGEVVRDHCVRSNGGLWYENYAEFEGMLSLLLGNEALSRRLGANGQAYVRREFSWDAVLARFHAALESWRLQPEPVSRPA